MGAKVSNFGVYFATFVFWSINGFLHPMLNWDMIPYVGAAMADRVSSQDLRRETLKDVRSFVGDEKYTSINNKNTYRKTVAADDRAFLAQLPFYHIKPLYVGSIRLLANITGNYSKATVLVSSFGLLLMGFALWRLRPGMPYPYGWAILVLGITASGPFPFSSWGPPRRLTRLRLPCYCLDVLPGFPPTAICLLSSGCSLSLPGRIILSRR